MLSWRFFHKVRGKANEHPIVKNAHPFLKTKENKMGVKLLLRTSFGAKKQFLSPPPPLLLALPTKVRILYLDSL
jgi:hypothetical protein